MISSDSVAAKAVIIRLRLNTQQASLLLDMLFDLETALWEVHGHALAELAQAELALEAHEAEAREHDLADSVDDADDIPF